MKPVPLAFHPTHTCRDDRFDDVLLELVEAAEVFIGPAPNRFISHFRAHRVMGGAVRDAEKQRGY